MNLKSTFVISVIVFLGMFIVINTMFYHNFENDLVGISEEKIVKNRGLSLLPLEEYVYEYRGEQTVEIRYGIKYGGDCMGIYIMGQYSGVCVDSAGNDNTKSNLSLNHPQIFFFKPWMLALDRNWNWSTVYLDKSSNKPFTTYYFEVTGEEKIYGRDSYRIRSEIEKVNATMWVDKEKRVLLKEVGNDYSIEITSAPFKLEK